MNTRRRFTGEFKAKVALEALRGDNTRHGTRFTRTNTQMPHSTLLIDGSTPPMPTRKDCWWRGKPSPTARPPLCRFNRNGMTCK